MECVIIPDEAYSKYRVSKIYDNLSFLKLVEGFQEKWMYFSCHCI